MNRHNPRWLGGFALALMLGPSGAQAQTARLFEELQGILKAEQIVVVVDRTGQDIRGKVAEISTSSLVLLVPEKASSGLDTYTGAKRTFAEGTIAEIFDSDPSGRKGRQVYLALARSFQDLQKTLKVGQMVEVTDDSGQKTKGKMAEVSPSSLVILTKEKTRDATGREYEAWTGRRTFIETAVAEIRRPDSLWNGALIGLGIGAAYSLVGLLVECSASSEYCDPAFANFALIFGGIGAAIGVGIDALVGGDRNVYYVSPHRTPGVTLSPMLGKDRHGVLISVRF